MRRTLSILFALALITAACGGDSAEPTATTAPETTTTTTTTTTTVPETTTTTEAPETTTTTEAVNPMVMLAAGMAGTYEGQWVNTTFGSEGPINLQIEASPDGTVNISLDLGGFVFGASDPDPEVISFNINDLEEGSVVESATLGPISFSVGQTGIVITAAEVPAEGIASMVVTAAPGTEGLVGAYSILFDEGDGAEGTIAITPAG